LTTMMSSISSAERPSIDVLFAGAEAEFLIRTTYWESMTYVM